MVIDPELVVIESERLICGCYSFHTIEHFQGPGSATYEASSHGIDQTIVCLITIWEVNLHQGWNVADGWQLVLFVNQSNKTGDH